MRAAAKAEMRLAPGGDVEMAIMPCGRIGSRGVNEDMHRFATGDGHLVQRDVFQRLAGGPGGRRAQADHFFDGGWHGLGVVP